MIYKEEKEVGAVFIELLLVLPILLIILAGAFEISRVINYKNAAIQLSSQAASQVYRECTSEKAILMSDCIQRVQRDMTNFAIENFPDDDGTGTSHVAITVYFNRANNLGAEEPQYQYTARADASQFLGANGQITNEHVFKFDFSDDDNMKEKPIALDDWNAVSAAIGANNAATILRNTNYLVVAQAYLRYKKTASFFGGNMFAGDFITDYTII